MRISSITTTSERGWRRVSADVDGAPLWFESADVALSPSPEAFASAMLMPALARGEALTLEDPVSLAWRSNVRRALPTFNQWWGYPEILPEPVHHSLKTTRAAQTVLCFTGGVDSFHTLLRSGYTVNYLVFALGFDVPLNDETRFNAFEPSLRAVAAATGATPVVIRANLREHPAFAPVSWERTHGGALAAVGHLLSDVAGRLLISSSFTYTTRTPWGSSWMTDHFWSSDRLKIIHFGADLLRQQKLQAIASDPLVRSHLRVCWENRAPAGNCSRCDKCIRTRLTLADCGELAMYPGFEGEESLARHIDAIPAVSRVREVHRELSRSERLAPEIRLALQKLIRRSGSGGNFTRQWNSQWRRIRSWIRGWI